MDEGKKAMSKGYIYNKIKRLIHLIRYTHLNLNSYFFNEANIKIVDNNDIFSIWLLKIFFLPDNSLPILGHFKMNFPSRPIYHQFDIKPYLGPLQTYIIEKNSKKLI